MDLHWLKPLLGRPAPFTTVYLDVTRADVAGEAEAADRWKAVRRTLEREGAPASVLDEIGERFAVPTGGKGPHGRVIVADAEGVRVDRVLSEPPAQASAVFGPAPALLPAVRAAEEVVHYVLVEVDRNGADLTWHSGDGARTGEGDVEHVDGGHDDVHKVKDGALSRRTQTRAEDSWQRNAEAVAAVLARRVAERSPDLVVLTGDVRAVALVRDEVDQHVRSVLVEVPGGARGEGVKRDAFEAKVADALDSFRNRRREAVLARFREGQGRGGGTVTALDDVIDVLRRGQVDELVLHESTLSTGLADKELWVGPEPLQLGTGSGDLDALGVAQDARRKLPAGVALVRAALGQDAGVTFAEDGSAELVDGIGAVLRWSDGSTPSESVPTQSADQRRLRNVV